MTDPDATHSLVMPFVVCTTQGGPFDDAAFIAGWACASIDHDLAALAATFNRGDSDGDAVYEQHIDSRTVPQVDLIAMRHEFTLTTEPWEEHPDKWTLATFTRSHKDTP